VSTSVIRRQYYNCGAVFSRPFPRCFPVGRVKPADRRSAHSADSTQAKLETNADFARHAGGVCGQAGA
jgi:hypothetical protein